MEVYIDPRVDKEIKTLPEADSSKIVMVVELLKQYGFLLSKLYLKKLDKNLWELRPGRYRLLFGLITGKTIVVTIFMKKTQKTPLKEINLAQQRLLSYQSP